jgi:hypothetical protein
MMLLGSLRTIFTSLMKCFGSLMIYFGSLMIYFGSLMMYFGSLRNDFVWFHSRVNSLKRVSALKKSVSQTER